MTNCIFSALFMVFLFLIARLRYRCESLEIMIYEIKVDEVEKEIEFYNHLNEILKTQNKIMIKILENEKINA